MTTAQHMIQYHESRVHKLQHHKSMAQRPEQLSASCLMTFQQQ